MEDITTEFNTQVGLLLAQIAPIFGIVIGLTAAVTLGFFVVKRVRGAVK